MSKGLKFKVQGSKLAPAEWLEAFSCGKWHLCRFACLYIYQILFLILFESLYGIAFPFQIASLKSYDAQTEKRLTLLPGYVSSAGYKTTYIISIMFPAKVCP